MFSVIIPVYNKAAYVIKAISSVLGQSHQAFELIIVNDGSTDNSLETIQQFNDSRIRIISQVNKGVSVARNYGASLANYDLISFLDADDWWEENYLEEILQLINEYPLANVWGCNYYTWKKGKRVVLKKGLSSDFEKGYINYFKVYSKVLCVPFNCSFVSVRKSSFIAAGGFDPKLTMGEDFDLWIRLSQMGPIAYLNKVLSNSNQDVRPSNRALGKLHEPENHFLWKLENYNDLMHKDRDFKNLTDQMKAYGLLPYYFTRKYHKKSKTIISTIDFQQIPKELSNPFEGNYRLKQLRYAIVKNLVSLKNILR